MHTITPTAESGGIGGPFTPAVPSRPADDGLTAELADRLRRTTFLLNSARLVMTDEVARGIAAEAVGQSLSTLAKARTLRRLDKPAA